jgi:SAM-dependent methyltransferase
MSDSSADALSHYAIRGGNPGRERLRLIASTLRPTTVALFDRLAIGEGHICLDVGCGGGDVTLELARRVGPRGLAVGTDIDDEKLELARSEAAAQGVGHITYERGDIRNQSPSRTYDFVYARFLLSHLPDPLAAAVALHRHVRPGGLVVLEDIDASGTFAWPPCPALERYQELYASVVRGRGGNPDIGTRLPELLLDAGFDDVDINVVQPASLRGPMKSIHAITMENIADALIADGIASRDECNALIRDLHAYGADPRTVTSLPRIVQTWGRRRG